MLMTEIFIAVLAGILIGLSFSLTISPFFAKKQIQKERFEANVELYHEILMKKQSQTYTYSPAIRKTINRVHASLLIQHQDQIASNSEHASTTRFEPSI